MLKRLNKWVRPCLAVPCFVLMASAQAETGRPGFSYSGNLSPLLAHKTVSSSAINWKNWSGTCSTGNFTGEVKGRYYRMPNGGGAAVIDSYRITKRNGQQGGNKANLNLLLGDGRMMQNPSGWAKSPDRMLQNGQWQSLNLGSSGYFKDMYLTYQFIFDKSGTDPWCGKNLRLG